MKTATDQAPFPRTEHSTTVLAVKGPLRRANRRALDRSGPFRTSVLTRGKGAPEIGISGADLNVLGGLLFDWHSNYFQLLLTPL